MVRVDRRSLSLENISESTIPITVHCNLLLKREQNSCDFVSFLKCYAQIILVVNPVGLRKQRRDFQAPNWFFMAKVINVSFFFQIMVLFEASFLLFPSQIYPKMFVRCFKILGKIFIGGKYLFFLVLLPVLQNYRQKYFYFALKKIKKSKISKTVHSVFISVEYQAQKQQWCRKVWQIVSGLFCI